MMRTSGRIQVIATILSARQGSKETVLSLEVTQKEATRNASPLLLGTVQGSPPFSGRLGPVP